MNKIHLAFLWHFHQPIYKDYSSNQYLLPWVRFHLIKNYYTMAHLLYLHEPIKATFNFTPCLLEQITDYETQQGVDYFLEISSKDPDKLIPEEIIFLINNFFLHNQKQIINQNQQYRKLKEKKEFILSNNANNLIHSFSHQEILDLQILFNLYWLPTNYLRDDFEITQLLSKRTRYTLKDRDLVMNKQQEVINKCLPLYRELLARQQIEISTSPYFHPIMPLMINTNLAINCQDTPVPQNPFSAIQDLEEQLAVGKKYAQNCFQQNIQGLWPSEGAVSAEIIPYVLNQGFNWLATDEAILYKSKEVTHRNALYKPYYLEHRGNRLYVFFRDRVISDLIGFSYSGMETKLAVNDFLSRINTIKKSDEKELVVSVILDGENPWDAYPNCGYDFLNHLYQALSSQNDINLCTFSEAVALVSPKPLEELATGSWVGGDFRLWIGTKEDNDAFEYLRKVRNDYLMFTEDEKDRAKKSLYAAEGSDWNWWYGNEENPGALKTFDYIYRTHLINVYKLNNREVPNFLNQSIMQDKPIKVHFEPRGLINPVIDGKITDYFEWHNASTFLPVTGGDVIALSYNLIDKFSVGFNQDSLFFLLVPAKYSQHITRFEMEISIQSVENRLILSINKINDQLQITCSKNINLSFQYDKVLEINFPFVDAGFIQGETISLEISILTEGRLVSRIPKTGYLSFTLPANDYLTRFWEV